MIRFCPGRYRTKVQGWNKTINVAHFMFHLIHKSSPHMTAHAIGGRCDTCDYQCTDGQCTTLSIEGGEHNSVSRDKF